MRQISKFRALPHSGASCLTQNLISKAEHLSNRVVFLASPSSAVHQNKINLVQSRSFHSQIGLTLNYREKYDEDEGGYSPEQGSRERRGRTERYGGDDRGSRFGGAGSGSRLNNKPWYEDDVPDEGHRSRGRDSFGSDDFGKKLRKRDWQTTELSEISKKLYKPTENVEVRGHSKMTSRNFDPPFHPVSSI